MDGCYLFVGSYNFDPRSAIHNTEMGIIFDAPMASAIERQIRVRLDDAAHQLKMDQDKISWHSQECDGVHTIQYQDSDTKWYKRFTAWIMSWLPIELLL